MRVADRALREWRHTTERKRLRKGLFLTAIVFNVGLLGFFKYADFFIDNTNRVAGTDFNLLLESQEAQIRTAMTNSFGFGGNNCSVVFSV